MGGRLRLRPLLTARLDLVFGRTFASVSRDPFLPEHFHDDESVHNGQLSSFVRKVQPHVLTLVPVLEAEVVLAWNREEGLYISQRNVLSALLDGEHVQLGRLLVVLRNVVEYIS